MTMTIEESRLEDLAKKAAHIQKTGYDYSKEAQNHIQSLVEIEIEKFLQNPRTGADKHLIPSPGLYNDHILIKHEDIYAYKESHPQCTAPISKRRSIIEALKTGNSKPIEKRVASKKPEKKVETSIRILDANNQEINKYSFISRDEYREWFIENLSYVLSNSKSSDSKFDYDIVVNSQYSSREINTAPKPAKKSETLKLAVSDNMFPPISEHSTHKIINNTVARADLKKSSTIGELAKDTEITVIGDYHYDGNWIIARSDSHSNYGDFFVLRKDVVLKEGVKEHPKDVSSNKSIPKPDSVSIDWTTQKKNIPYYDPSDAKYKVSVETSFKKMESVSDILSEGFSKGAKTILENLGKASDETSLDYILDNDYYEKAVRATDIYVDNRKGSGILVLVEAPHRYVVTLPDETRIKSVYYCEDYDSSTLLNQINQVVKKIESIQNDIENYDGVVLNINTKREKNNLSLVAPTIRELFSRNGFSGDVLKSNGIITMKWDGEFKLIGLEYESEDAKKKIVVKEGLVEEITKEHMESQRTQQILYTLYEIISEGLEKPWTEFLEDYISYDNVEIISEQSNANVEAQIEEKEAGPVKTLSQYNKEQLYYSNLDRKAAKAKIREAQSDFAGSALLDEDMLKSLKDNIGSEAKDAYDKFLNNVDFRKITLNSVKSLITEKINEETDNLLSEVNKIEKDIDKYKARLEDGVKKARYIADEAANTIEKGSEYLKNAGFTHAGDYFPKITRDFDLQGIDGIDFDIAGSMNFLSDTVQSPQEVQAYMNQIKNIDSPVFETMSKFSGNESFVSEASEILSQDAESVFSVDDGSIGDSVLDSFANNSGLDDRTNNLLKEGAKNLIKGGSVDFKKVTHFPQMKFDDLLPTDDISEAFYDNLKDSMSSMLNERIKHLVKSTLTAAESSLFPNSSPSRNRRNNSPGDTFEEPDVSLDKQKSKPLIDKMFGPTVTPDDLQNVIDDVGNLLAPRELCDLLNGNPNDETLDLSKSILRVAYPQMHLTTSSKVRNFFSSISRYSDYDNCGEISKEVPDYITDDYLCPPNSSLREGILKDKGMSDSQIKEQLERERDRSKKLAEDLLDQLKNGLLSENSKAPDNFCSKSPDGKVTPGQNSFMDENFKYTLQSTISKTFEPIYSFFKSDAGTFMESLFDNDPELGRLPLAHIRNLSVKKGQVRYLQDSKQIKIDLPLEEKLPDVGSEGNRLALQDLQNITDTESSGGYISIIESSRQPGNLSSSITTRSSVIITNQDLPQSFLSYGGFGADDYVASRDFLEKLLLKSYSANTNITSTQKDTISSSIKSIQNGVRDEFLSNLFSELKGSPYLKDIGEELETSGDIKIENREYILDYINLCPPPNEDCDPHLLNVRGEVDKIYNSFKDDMCASPNSKSDEANPLEGSMMSSCVNLIIRHYLIENLLKGITSLSTTQGKDRIDKSILKYILANMKKNMKTYSTKYYNDFKKSAKESYQGTNEADEMILDMMQQEYSKISRLLFEVLFLGDRNNNYRQKIISSIPIVELREILGEQNGILEPVNAQGVTEAPLLVIVNSKDKFHLCLPLEEPPVNVTVNDPGFTDFYRICRFGSIKRNLIPVCSSKSLQEIYKSKELKILLDVCFPVEQFATAMFIHEIETASRINDIDMAFGNTRDGLFSIFYAVKPQADDWKKESPLLKELGNSSGLGGSASLTGLWDFNFGVFDTPVTKDTFNFGLPLGWGTSFKGLFFSFAAKAVKDAAMKTFKNSVESADPNIIFSKKLSKQIKLAGKNVSTTEISALMSLVNPLLYPQTPSSITYHALGLGSYIKSKIDANSPEGAEKAGKIFNAETGLKKPQLCEEMLLD